MVKLIDDSPTSNNDDSQPPSDNAEFDHSKYRGGPSPFINNFDYDNPDHTKENVRFTDERRMDHSYDFLSCRKMFRHERKS